MDSSQCGPSNPMKDFSRLTLEDRSRYQDRVSASQGAHQTQNFRTNPGNSLQANADFAGFQSGQDGLPVGPLPVNAQVPGVNAGPPALSPYGAQFRQPQTAAPGAHPTFLPQGFHHPPNVTQPISQPNGFHSMGAINARPSTGSTVQAIPPATQAAYSRHFDNIARANVPPANIHTPSIAGPGFPSMHHQATFSNPFQPYSQMGHPMHHPHSPFQQGQAQQAPAVQSPDFQAQQQEFDREFQLAMDAWMSEHGDVTGVSQTDTTASTDSKEATQTTGVAHQENAQDSLTREVDAQVEQTEGLQVPSIDNATASISPNQEAELQAVKDEKAPPHNRSDLSVAAQKILDAVASEDTDKFQGSSFFRLMRGLATEDIVLEGRDFVQRDGSSSPAAAAGSGSHVTGSTSAASQDRKGKGKAATVEDYIPDS